MPEGAETMDALIVLKQMVVILVLVAVGFFLRRRGTVDAKMKQGLSNLVVQVFNPALIVSGVLGDGGSRDTRSVLIVTGIAAASYAILILIGHVLGKLQTRRNEEQRMIELMYVFSNVGFIGIPVIQAVLGDQYIIYVAIFIIEYNLLIYTYGAALMDGAGKGGGERKMGKASDRPSPDASRIAGPDNAAAKAGAAEGQKARSGATRLKKAILNPGTLAGILALVLFFGHIQLPYILTRSISYLAQIATPMSLLIIGFTVAEQEDLKAVLKNRQMYVFTLMKMLAVPYALSFFLKLLPVPLDIQMLVLVMLAMPVGSMPLLMANERGFETDLCSDCILSTTIVSVLTLPLLVAVY